MAIDIWRTTKVIPVVVLTLLTGCSSFGHGSALQRSNEQLLTTGRSHALVNVVLPRSLFPSDAPASVTQPVRLAQGTQVYRVPSEIVEYVVEDNGKPVGHSQTISGFGLTNHLTPNSLEVSDADGQFYVFPKTAQISKQSKSFVLAFFQPDKSKPKSVQGLVPDYIVP